MSAQIGLAVNRDAVRAVLVRGTAVVWREERALAAADDVAVAVAELLRRAPVRRWPPPVGPRVVAAVGASRSQLKRLVGIPQQADEAVVTNLVRSNIGRFFLCNGIPIATSRAQRQIGGSDWWGAAIEQPVVAAVERGCTLAGLSIAGCLPSAAALAYAIRAGDGDATCSDAGVRAYVSVRAGRWVGSGRDAGAMAVAMPEFADAIAAARAPAGAALVRAVPPRDASHTARRLRIGLAAAVIVAGVGALVAPGVAATRAEVRDRRELAELEAAAAQWAPVARELQSATAGLAEIARFTRERRSAVRTLAALADALPDSSALLSLRTDSAGGSLTLLSSGAAAAVQQLSAEALVRDVRVGGAFTRENVGGAPLQRVAVRFRWAP